MMDPWIVFAVADFRDTANSYCVSYCKGNRDVVACDCSKNPAQTNFPLVLTAAPAAGLAATGCFLFFIALLGLAIGFEKVSRATVEIPYLVGLGVLLLFMLAFSCAAIAVASGMAPFVATSFYGTFPS